MSILFFDMGYTLVDESDVWVKRCGEQAQTPRAKALGLTADDIYREICSASRARLPQYRTVADKFGFEEAGETVPYRCEFERLYPCAPELLDKLHRRYRLGIIANQPEGLENRLCRFGIRQYFDVIVSSSDCGIMKPDVEIFTYALKQAGCRASEAYMIGDRLDNDILPAKACGMHTVWVRQGFGAFQTPNGPYEEPDETVCSIESLESLFLPAENPMPKEPITEELLVKHAYRAMQNAYAPYSNHTVGAALLSDDGRVFYGCNVENASFTPTCCAERVALFKAVSDGARSFSAIAIVGGKNGVTKNPCPPCGVCRQALREFCNTETFKIYLGYDGADSDHPNYKEYTLAELLPESFGPDAISEK